jgi:cysteine-rich repeat protein
MRFIKNSIFMGCFSRLFISFCFICLLVSVSFVYAEESCYLDFSFNEKLIINNSQNLDSPNLFINFSYNGLNNVYGNYQRFVSNYDSSFPKVYNLNTYNSLDNKLNVYSFDTSFSIENIENLDGILNSVIIPYDDSISLIKIFQGDELKLEFIPEEISCERTCLIEGENGTSNKRCCLNYIKSWLSNDVFTCVNCGDGVCSEFENEYLCWSDCKPDKEDMNCSSGYVASDYGCVEANVCGNGVVEKGEDCDDGNLIDGDECSSRCNLGGCFDADLDLNSIFEFSFVRYNSSYFEDYCLDEQVLVEYYCGRVWKWDFWNIKNEPKTFQQVCQYGCEMGRCLTQEENIVDPDEPVEELDLPDEPPVLG